MLERARRGAHAFRYQARCSRWHEQAGCVVMIRTKFTVVFALTVLVLAGAAQPAFAGPQDLNRMLNNIGLSITDSENVMTAFAYLAGIFMGVWGIFKFRDHVDNPQATRLGPLLGQHLLLECGL